MKLLENPRIKETETPKRTFGMQDVSGAKDINEILDKLQVGDYSARKIPEVCEGYQVISDDFGNPVSIVSETWDLLQPLECFSFMDALKTNLGFNYTGAGFTHNGKRMQIIAEVKDHEVKSPKKGDIVKKRLVARTSFDGSISTNIKIELYRLWCKNGCGNWISGDMNIRARHSKNQRVILNEAIDQATGLKNIFLNLEKDMDHMAQTKVRESQVRKVIHEVFPLESTRSENIRDIVWSEFSNEDRGTFGNSAWDLFNAFTSYQTHLKTTRETKQTSKKENRYHTTFASGFSKKVRKAIAEHTLANAI